jgi:peroxiredoxin
MIREEIIMYLRYFTFIVLFLFPFLLSSREKPLINFTLETLEGERVSLHRYLEDGPVYISFWALWCQPCLQKMRMLLPAHENFEKMGATILLINIDDPNSIARVRAFVRSQNVSFPVLLDPSERVFEMFNGRAIPYSVLLDSTGRIVKTQTGYIPGDEKKIEDEIKKLIIFE